MFPEFHFPISAGQNYSAENYSFTLFPNPANDNMILNTGKSFSGKRTLFIYDLSGKEILRKEIFTQQTLISVAQIPSGLYICSLRDKNGFSANTKLIISR